VAALHCRSGVALQRRYIVITNHIHDAEKLSQNRLTKPAKKQGIFVYQHFWIGSGISHMLVDNVVYF
jgi:hypothetical protein